jgi:hypothetical protein
MGIDPKWIGYLNYCHQNGLGQYDMSMIDVEGPQVATLVKKYRLHKDIERELEWMGPLKEVPPRLG